MSLKLFVPYIFTRQSISFSVYFQINSGDTDLLMIFEQVKYILCMTRNNIFIVTECIKQYTFLFVVNYYEIYWDRVKKIHSKINFFLTFMINKLCLNLENVFLYYFCLLKLGCEVNNMLFKEISIFRGRHLLK